MIVANLTEGEWELDGFVFGGWSSIRIMESGVDYGSSDVRVQDVDNSASDGSTFGRDFLTGPEWALTLGVLDGLDVWSVVAPLQVAWRADAVRSTPGALSVLRHCRNGVTYRAYGRGRKFGVIPESVADPEFQQVSATFKLAGPEQCIETPAGAASLTVRLVESANAGEGFPVPAPVSWAGSAPSLSGHGVVTVGGVLPASFRVTVKGPVTGSLTGVFLAGNGWEFATSAPVPAGQNLVLDTRTQSVTVNGRSIAGTLSRKSRLTARLAPGAQQVTFNGSDPSNTSTATFSWYPTIPA